jgi:hypothetical protein
MTDVTDRKQVEEELRNSIEPFRGLVKAMEKYFPGTEGAEAKVRADTAVPWLRSTNRFARSALKWYLQPVEPVLPPS